MGPGDVGESIAFSNDDSCSRAETRGYCRQENMGPCHDVVGINDGRVDGDQIVPAKAFAEILLRELPEGVAGLDCYYVQFRPIGGCGTCGRGRLQRRHSNDRRGRLRRSYAKDHRFRRRRTNHWRCGLCWRYANGGRGRRHHAKVRRGRSRFSRGHRKGGWLRRRRANTGRGRLCWRHARGNPRWRIQANDWRRRGGFRGRYRNS